MDPFPSFSRILSIFKCQIFEERIQQIKMKKEEIEPKTLEKFKHLWEPTVEE